MTFTPDMTFELFPVGFSPVSKTLKPFPRASIPAKTARRLGLLRRIQHPPVRPGQSVPPPLSPRRLEQLRRLK